MKRAILMFIGAMTLQITLAQEIIAVPYDKDPAIRWEVDEKAYFSELWDTAVVTNVAVPSMEVFRPENPNGTAVIVAPGGGLYALSIKSEGTAVAEWLAARGVTAFVLKYRLVPTGEDGIQEITDEAATNPMVIGERVAPIMPLSIADALSAICYVREHSKKFKIDADKIGLMGFSAGGAVTMGVGYNYSKEGRPDFLVPIYPWITVYPVQEAPADAPPMMVICATDDPLGLAEGSIKLYASWLKANKPVALQMFSKGGHGFGMKEQNLPSDNWIQHFYDWAVSEGLITKGEGN